SIFASIRLRFTACCAKDEYRASASAVRGDSAARRSKYGSTGQPGQSTKNPCPRANPKAARHESSRQTILRAPAFLSSSAKSSGHAPLGLTKGNRTARRGLQRNASLGNRRPSPVAEYFGRLAATYGDGEYYGNRRRAVLETIAGEIAD